MRIGMVGCGKLGMPVAACLAMRHHVLCHDVDPELMRKGKWPHLEEGIEPRSDFQPLLDKADLAFVDLPILVQGSDIVFVAVQTPHQHEFGGTERLTERRADFDYSFLVSAVEQIARHADPSLVVAIISTVLPGTLRRLILPITRGRCRLAYAPQFIAMGTVVRDYLDPEFVLIGADDLGTADRMEAFFSGFYGAVGTGWAIPQVVRMSIESAELTKVAYNTIVSTKIAVANVLGEMAHKIPGCNVDDVANALKRATRRLVSTAYMDAGMGDGGACFLPLSLVRTRNGLRAISVVEPGCEVLTADGSFAKVLKRWERHYHGDTARVIISMGRVPIEATVDHPFFTFMSSLLVGDTIQAGDLTMDHSLVWPCPDGTLLPMRVAKVERSIYDGVVFNLWVDHPSHSYVTSVGLAKNCHPRDGIAMSWLARKLRLSHDIFGDAMRAREDQAGWFADLIEHYSSRHDRPLPVVILGIAFKPETNILAGGPSILLQNILLERGVAFEVHDPHVDKTCRWLDYVKGRGFGLESAVPRLFFIATKHRCFADYDFAAGSVILDPHRYIRERPGVTVIPLGIGKQC